MFFADTFVWSVPVPLVGWLLHMGLSFPPVRPGVWGGSFVLVSVLFHLTAQDAKFFPNGVNDEIPFSMYWSFCLRLFWLVFPWVRYA